MAPLDQITQLIRTRRSVKPPDMDATRPIEHTLVEQLLENATWAPTHGMTEPWRFVVFTGAAKQLLADQLSQTYKRTMPAEEFREDKMHKMSTNPILAPVVIATCVERTDGGKIPEIGEVEAVACALQNLMLSATAAGLVSFWSSPPLLDAASFKAWLGIRPQDRCVALLYLGYPRADAPRARSVRRPLAQCVSWRSEV